MNKGLKGLVFDAVVFVLQYPSVLDAVVVLLHLLLTWRAGRKFSLLPCAGTLCVPGKCGVSPLCHRRAASHLFGFSSGKT